jgi:hypothetical protein
MLAQRRGQRPRCFAAAAQPAAQMGTHAGIATASLANVKEWVVASAMAFRLVEDGAKAHPFGLRHGATAWIGECHGRNEASAAVEGAMQLLQQAVLAFMVGGGITSGKEAWPAIKGVDLNAGIIA